MISCDLYAAGFPFPFLSSTIGDFLGDIEFDVVFEFLLDFF